jgi:hypothetical protein
VPKRLFDDVTSSDSVAVLQGIHLADGMRHKTIARIDKFMDPDNIIHKLVTLGCPLEVLKSAFADKYLGSVEFDSGEPSGNLCLNSGIQSFEGYLAGISTPSPHVWSNAYAYLGVGDSTTAAVATQTDLQAATNKTYVGMVASYPSQSSQTLTWQSSFGSGSANYAWQEFVVTNSGGSGGTCLNRLVSAQGTKTSGQTWILSLSITWS